jgi:hypothetical protein
MQRVSFLDIQLRAAYRHRDSSNLNGRDGDDVRLDEHGKGYEDSVLGR